ncbi:cofilin [Coemansia sp. RSA 1933]|nr:cofilin [Coemansia sp. RSA 1933]
MSSGIAVSEECITRFNELRDNHKYKYVIFRIGQDLKSIIVEKTSEDDKNDAEDAPAEDADSDSSETPAEELSGEYGKFVRSFPKKDGRYAVYDFDYVHDGGQRNKLLFYTWAPDNAPVKSKMLYASSKKDIEQKLSGVSTVIQATEKSDLFYKNVLEKLQRFH